MHGRDAAAALGACAEIERLAAGARTLLAARVEETRAWAGTGSTSAAHWLAEQAGTSVGEAAGTLRTGKRLADQPEVRQAVRDGALSAKQAELVSQGAAADPAAAGSLLDLAGKASLGELREQSQRTIAAADVDEMAGYRRVRRTRYWRHRRDPDGAWVGTIRTTPDGGALLMAGINAARPAIFDAARRSGHWDPAEAYDADALVSLAAAFLSTPLPPPPTTPNTDRGPAPNTSGDDSRDTGAETTRGAPAAGAPGADSAGRAARGCAASGANPPDGGTSDEDRTTEAVAAVLELFPGAQAAAAVPASPDACNDADATHTDRTIDAATTHTAGTDATCADAAGADAQSPPAARGAPPGRRRRASGSRTPLVARVDHAALARGRTRPTECCEITAIGPVPVKIIRELLGSAFIAAVAVDEQGNPTRVAHLGRRSKAAKAAAHHYAPPGSGPPGADPPQTTPRGADPRGHHPPKTPPGAGPPGADPPQTTPPGADPRGHHPPKTPPGAGPPWPPPSGTAGRGWAGAAEDLGPNTKVIVAVPESALTEAADREPIVDALRHHGVPVAELTHHKRPFNAQQRTVLEYRDPQCAVLGCTATARLERDHRDDWAHTHTTDAHCADRLCDPHHDLKTRHGWRLEPGTGKRRLLPPGRCHDAR
jgi:hypothetical protein